MYWVVAKLPDGEDGACGGSGDEASPGEHNGSVQQKGKPTKGADVNPVPKGVLAWMTILSFLVFGLGLSIAFMFGGL